MADDWHFTRNRNLQGPVSFERLQKLAAEGWLLPTDLVWHAGMTEWTAAGQVQGLFGNHVSQLLQSTFLGKDFVDPVEAESAPRQSRVPELPPPPEKLARRRARQANATQVHIAWEQLRPRHVIAAIGGFLAALGISFTVIDQSRVALAFTVTGLCIVAAGLCVEVWQLFGQALGNIGAAWKESAERRLRAKEMALEKQRLDLEVARLAQQDRHLERILPTEPVDERTVVGSGANGAPTSGNVVIVNQPPVRLWSPGFAALLSFFVPGLGQLYKGQFFNGLMWFFMVMFGYAALVIPGLILHFFCVLGALSGNPWTEGKTTVVRE
jgi:TM2 domain-containing membrane protein YozV